MKGFKLCADCRTRWTLALVERMRRSVEEGTVPEALRTKLAQLSREILTEMDRQDVAAERAKPKKGRR